MVKMGIDKGQAIYGAYVRKKAESFLKGQTEKLGKFNVRKLKYNNDHFKQRWMIPRANRLGIVRVDFDKDDYRLSRKKDMYDRYRFRKKEYYGKS